MWRIARAAAEDGPESSALDEPHPRMQIEKAVWYEVTYDKVRMQGGE